MEKSNQALKFKYRADKRCHTITWSVAGGVLLAAGLLWWLSPGEYLPVWFSSIVLAVTALTLLSVPRSIRLNREALEIHCLVEITHIPWHHIRSARRTERVELGPLVPVFASVGVFGWFGYWLDARSWEFIKLYTTSQHGLVMIEDIYEQKYVVSASDPDALCRTISERINARVEHGQFKIEFDNC